MHVQLLKKIGTLHFVGRVLESSAIVRFQPARPLLAPVGALCHVTNCIFDHAAKLVKCEAECADASPADASPADKSPSCAPDVLRAAPQTTLQPPTKRRRVCFADETDDTDDTDETDDTGEACAPSPCAPKTACA